MGPDEKTRIVAGSEYDSLADFRAAIRAWGVEDGFSPAILDSDAKRVRVGCRTSRSCPFRIRCNFDPIENKARVSTVISKHTCNPEADNPGVFRGEVTKMSFLVDAVPQLMIVDHSTSPKEIIEKVANRYGQTIALRQAQKVKSTLLSIASEQVGQSLYAKIKESRGEEARDEERRKGKRVRFSYEAIDPRLYEDANDQDYKDEGLLQGSVDDDANDLDGYEYDYEENDEYDDNDEHELRTDHELEERNGDTSPLESNTVLHMDVSGQVEGHEGLSATELRARGAVLFQQSSKMFQEASRLHMEASRLFSEASELEKPTNG